MYFTQTFKQLELGAAFSVKHYDPRDFIEIAFKLAELNVYGDSFYPLKNIICKN
jgi:hypothetical protein